MHIAPVPVTSKFTISTHPNHFVPEFFSEKPIPKAKGAPTQLFRALGDFAGGKKPAITQLGRLKLQQNPLTSCVLTSFDPCDGTSRIPMWLLANDFQKLRDLKITPIPKEHKVEGSTNLEVRDVAGKGQGLFTTRSFKAGEVILMERPIQVTTSVLGSTPTVSADEVYEALYDRQTPANQKDYMTLRNCKTEEEAGSHQGIARTNQHRVFFVDPGEQQCGVFPTISKCNHSWHFHPEYLAMDLKAECDIPAGTELVASYLGDDCELRESRRVSLLQMYKFVCDCPSCNDPPRNWRASDRRRTLVCHWYDGNCESRDWLISGKMSNSVYIQKLLDIIEIAREEGLHRWVRRFAESLALAYSALGNAAECQRWANVALPDGDSEVSKGCYSITQMSKDPTKDNTWRLKIKMMERHKPIVINASEETMAEFDRRMASVHGKEAKQKMHAKLMREMKDKDGRTFASVLGISEEDAKKFTTKLV